MKLIVGLGNPGKKYEGTRHNMGFMTIDLFSDVSKIDIDREAFQGMVGRGKLFDQDVMLFKPTTFMNLSGHAVREVVAVAACAMDSAAARMTGTVRSLSVFCASASAELTRSAPSSLISKSGPMAMCASSPTSSRRVWRLCHRAPPARPAGARPFDIHKIIPLSLVFR